MGALVGVATACGSQGGQPCLAMVERSRNSISISDYLVCFVACSPFRGCAPVYPISHTIRVIHSLVFSIFVREVTWCNWTVSMGEKCVWV
jgi:hypothetical protein